MRATTKVEKRQSVGEKKDEGRHKKKNRIIS